MAEVFFIIFLFIAITVLAAVLFGGWVVFGVGRLIWRVVSGALGVSESRTAMRLTGVSTRACTHARCNQQNPTCARFCRRCGTHLPEARHVAVRRAAMW